jgi:hypothetical protein
MVQPETVIIPFRFSLRCSQRSYHLRGTSFKTLQVTFLIIHVPKMVTIILILNWEYLIIEYEDNQKKYPYQVL